MRRKAELEAFATAKRKRKADKARLAMDGEDPFGPDIAAPGSDSSGAGMDID